MTTSPTASECKECGSTAFTWHCTQTNRNSIPDGRLRMHDVNTRFFYSCDDCSETVRTAEGDEVAQWMTVTKANPKKQAASTRLTITFWDSEEGLEVDLHGETLEALHNELCRYDGCAPSGSIHVYDEAGFIVGWVSTGGWRSA